MPNQVYKITLPLIAGTTTLQGTTATDDFISLDTQTPGAAVGTSTSIYTALYQNENGTLTFKAWDWAKNTATTLNLPSLSNANAVEYLTRVNATTPQFNGAYKLMLAGDYSRSAQEFAYIIGTSGNDRIFGSTASNAVSQIYGGNGDDTITGSGFFSTLDGGRGTNTLHGLGGTNYFRMYTGDGGTDTILADAGSSSRLQIYVNGTNAINSTQLWNFKRVGDDLEGFVNDPNGGKSAFTIQNQFSTNPVSFFQIYETGTDGAYISAGLTNEATGTYQIFAGTDTADTFSLAGFQKSRAYVFGNAGADTLISTDGVVLRFYNDINSELDTVIYGKASSNYVVTSKVLASGAISTNVKPQGATTTDYLANVDRIQFTDTMVGLDVGMGQNVGEVFRLYLTVLGRNPKDDPTGSGFWIDRLDKGILTGEQMVSSFLTSDEFTSRFGATTSTNDAFVNLMYLNLLKRDGHADPGFDFWVNVLNNKMASRAQVVYSFMESAENVANAATLIGDAATFQLWTS